MKKARWVLFVLYCLFIVWYTLLSRHTKPARTADLRLFWSFRDLLAGKSTGKTDVIQNINNILFFIPFELLLPLKKWWKVLLVALCFSATIEVAQYIFALGLCELDDVISNTFGALIGYWIWLGLKKIMRSSDETSKETGIL